MESLNLKYFTPVLQFLAVVFGLFPMTSRAQSAEGKIYYDVKTNMHKRIADEAMRAMIPEFRTVKMELVISGDVSLYGASEADNEEQVGGNGNMRVSFRAPVEEIYRDYPAGTAVSKKELAGQAFIVQDTIRALAWKIDPAETKTIGGIVCMKAVTTQKISATVITSRTSSGKENDNKKVENQTKPKEQTVVAWFAESIPSKAGPSIYGGLPGAVLEVSINDDEMVFQATKIELGKVGKKDLKIPKGGKKVSSEEFMRIQQEYMKEVQSGGGLRFFRN